MFRRGDVYRHYEAAEIQPKIQEFYRFSLKDWQLQAAQAALGGKDSIVIAPTGGGKSVAFQSVLHVVPHSIILIIEPTKTLITDQVNIPLTSELTIR